MNYYTIDRQTEREREIIESLTTSSGKKYYGTRKEKRSVLYSFIGDVCLCASNGASLLFFFFSHRSLFVLLQYTHTHTSKTAYCPIFFSRAYVVGLLFASWLFYSSLSFFPEHIHTYTKSGFCYRCCCCALFLFSFSLSIFFCSRACACPSSFYIIHWEYCS